nr:uncharacterized protein LOC113702981 isoform X1 [Coffea arabica]
MDYKCRKCKQKGHNSRKCPSSHDQENIQQQATAVTSSSQSQQQTPNAMNPGANKQSQPQQSNFTPEAVFGASGLETDTNDQVLFDLISQIPDQPTTSQPPTSTLTTKNATSPVHVSLLVHTNNSMLTSFYTIIYLLEFLVANCQGKKVKYRCGVCRRFGHTRSSCDSTLASLYKRHPWEPPGLARPKNTANISTSKSAAKRAKKA